MGVRRPVVVALAAALTALVAPAPAAAAPPAQFYGVVPQDGGLATQGDLETMRGGGVGSIRMLAHWATVEAEPGSYDWTITDQLVRSAVNNGLRPLLFLYGTPEWAARRDGHACRSDACAVYAPRSGATRRAFAGFAAAAVRRYGPGGTFWQAPEESCAIVVPVVCPDGPLPPCHCSTPAPLRTWQIWNEPNSPTFFAPAPNFRAYARIVKRASAAIRNADPGAEVVLGGMWGPNTLSKRDGRRPVTPLAPYLKRFYRVRKVAKAFDAIGLHPYASGLKGVRAQMKGARRVARRAGDRKVKTWITEIGWASDGAAKSPYVKGLSGQARMLTRAFSFFKRKRRAFRLRGVFWYSWRDKPGAAACDWCHGAGLRNADGSAKPAWDAFVRVAR